MTSGNAMDSKELKLNYYPLFQMHATTRKQPDSHS